MSQEITISTERLLQRYRLIMVALGILYPLWRYAAYFIHPNTLESWAMRGMIGVFFLVITWLTYNFDYFRKNVSTYFNIIVYIWTVQVFYLMYINQMEFDYMLLGLFTVFCIGGTFLNRNGMLGYYLLCILLTGAQAIAAPSSEAFMFFGGVVIALTMSYICFQSLLGLFRELHLSREALQVRTKEFERLSVAVQSLFLPLSNQKKTDLFDLVGFYRPADGCGGDWWSHFSPDDETLFVFVGDVTGHGPGSAMMTASVASYLKAMEHLPGVPNVPDLLLRLNEYLIELQASRAADERYLMTMVGFEIKLAQKEMTIYSAGHPFPFILRADGTVEVVGGTGMPLGYSHEMTLGRESVYLNSGDRLFAYTDGLTEMKTGPERMYGEKRLSKLLATTRSMAALASPAHIVAKLDEARKELLQDDDFTFVVLDIA